MQVLWGTLRRKYLSIQAIDAAFAVHETLLSFLNLEMLSKMRTLTLLALATWESSAKVARSTVIAAFLSQHYLGPDHDSYAFNTTGVDFGGLSYMNDHVVKHIGYFGVIPFVGMDKDDATSASGFGDSGYREGVSNELWIAVADQRSSTFLTCDWSNVTWEVNITNSLAEQTVQVARTEFLNKANNAVMSYGVTSDQANLSTFLYTAIFRGVAKNLLGYMGINRMEGDSTTVLSSEIQATVLSGSKEYISMVTNLLGEDNKTVVASHKSLKDMIEEFGQNVTLNLMSEDFFRLVPRVSQHMQSH
ncbi:hypothetical protein SLS54_000515 [Diplodia seriata]